MKKQKLLGPWEIFKEMSKELSVAGTMHRKPGLCCTLETVVPFSFPGPEAFLSVFHLSGSSSVLLWWQKHHSGISVLLICIWKLGHFPDHSIAGLGRSGRHSPLGAAGPEGLMETLWKATVCVAEAELAMTL